MAMLSNTCVNNSLVLPLDRKSTRLNSSHLVISYAVFCLKKKKKTKVCFETADMTTKIVESLLFVLIVLALNSLLCSPIIVTYISLAALGPMIVKYTARYV